MNKVITINLNGKAFQVEERGFAKLQEYLTEAESRLAQDPSKDEIVKDLEQGIAEKLERFLNPNKNVITLDEAEGVLKEMGPVESVGAETGSGPKTDETKTSSGAKRLYRIEEGAMVRGVCTGLAAYFDVDVTVIRLIFAVLTILTHGVGVLIYIVMMVVVPRANTSAQKAAARGEPFTAQEWVDRARAEYSKYADKSEWRKWKREFKQQMRQERREWKAKYHQSHPVIYTPPFLGFFTFVLSVLWIAGLVTILTHQAVFGWAVPASIPLWIAALIWLCLYSFVVWPLKAWRWSAYRTADGKEWHYHHHNSFFESVVWLAFWIVLIWALWRYVPVTHPYFDKVSLWWQHVWATLKSR